MQFNVTVKFQQDFNPIYPHTDPTKTDKMAFSLFADRLRNVPTHITPGAASPLNRSHAHSYRDNSEWSLAHD